MPKKAFAKIATPRILYHLNAGEYTEQYDFPKDPVVAKRFAQRGVIHSWANADGTQKIEDKGAFGQERQRTLDEEVLVESQRFIRDPRSRPASLSSCGTTPRACTTAPT